MFAPGDKHQLKLKMSITATSILMCIFEDLQRKDQVNIDQKYKFLQSVLKCAKSATVEANQ